MTDPPRAQVITTWFGDFVVDGGRIVRAYPFPSDAAAIAERVRLRRDGRLTPEEEQLLADTPPSSLQSRDRRLVARGVAFGGSDRVVLDPRAFGIDGAIERAVLLDDGADALKRSWDPSIHVEEAVRALSELDRILNLLSERLTSWAGRDTLTVEGEYAENPKRVAEAIVESRWVPAEELPGVDASLVTGRQALARLYLAALVARDGLELAVTEALPRRAPNLDRLLGAELAARLISQAGGLDRLARLPAGTVQVLGAEKAFFEHLRGRAPPPRHGLLFLHPAIQSAPRWQRGKLARSLAGKAVIAARLDLAGAPVTPTLSEAFDRRISQVKSARARHGREGPRRSAPPLDRAAEDR